MGGRRRSDRSSLDPVQRLRARPELEPCWAALGLGSFPPPHCRSFSHARAEKNPVLFRAARRGRDYPGKYQQAAPMGVAVFAATARCWSSRLLRWKNSSFVLRRTLPSTSFAWHVRAQNPHTTPLRTIRVTPAAIPVWVLRRQGTARLCLMGPSAADAVGTRCTSRRYPMACLRITLSLDADGDLSCHGKGAGRGISLDGEWTVGRCAVRPLGKSGYCRWPTVSRVPKYCISRK